jgi:hypothetical protein
MFVCHLSWVNVSPLLDLAYLRRWADRLGIAELLLRAFDDAGLTTTDSEE